MPPGWWCGRSKQVACATYLVPRECPRVTYYAGSASTAADVERLLGSSPAVVAIESDWLERVRSTRLYGYHMPPETFECLDACAGYYVSREPVVPSRVEIFDDPPAELVKRGVELRVVQNLWPLRDAVVASSLVLSHSHAQRGAEDWDLSRAW